MHNQCLSYFSLSPIFTRAIGDVWYFLVNTIQVNAGEGGSSVCATRASATAETTVEESALPAQSVRDSSNEKVNSNDTDGASSATATNPSSRTPKEEPQPSPENVSPYCIKATTVQLVGATFQPAPHAATNRLCERPGPTPMLHPPIHVRRCIL